MRFEIKNAGSGRYYIVDSECKSGTGTYLSTAAKVGPVVGWSSELVYFFSEEAAQKVLDEYERRQKPIAKMRFLPSFCPNNDKWYISDGETLLRTDGVAKMIDCTDSSDDYYFRTRAEAQAALNQYLGIKAKPSYVYIVYLNGEPIYTSLVEITVKKVVVT